MIEYIYFLVHSILTRLKSILYYPFSFNEEQLNEEHLNEKQFIEKGLNEWKVHMYTTNCYLTIIPVERINKKRTELQNSYRLLAKFKS
jgi:hypothetical protein